MQKIIFLLSVSFISLIVKAQVSTSGSCNDQLYRQFDFWVGEWDVYAKNGNKAGDSKISIILDSCIILEEWTSASISKGIRYAGKSFNTYNSATQQWQQTWVDNIGGSTEFLKGKFQENKIIFLTYPYPYTKDTLAIRQLTFYNLAKDKVRQVGEISKDNGISWKTEYDLEYRRKK